VNTAYAVVVTEPRVLTDMSALLSAKDKAVLPYLKITHVGPAYSEKFIVKKLSY
jgi:hypothetical protein